MPQVLGQSPRARILGLRPEHDHHNQDKGCCSLARVTASTRRVCAHHNTDTSISPLCKAFQLHCPRDDQVEVAAHRRWSLFSFYLCPVSVFPRLLHLPFPLLLSFSFLSSLTPITQTTDFLQNPSISVGFFFFKLLAKMLYSLLIKKIDEQTVSFLKFKTSCFCPSLPLIFKKKNYDHLCEGEHFSFSVSVKILNLGGKKRLWLFHSKSHQFPFFFA